MRTTSQTKETQKISTAVRSTMIFILSAVRDPYRAKLVKIFLKVAIDRSFQCAEPQA